MRCSRSGNVSHLPHIFRALIDALQAKKSPSSRSVLLIDPNRLSHRTTVLIRKLARSLHWTVVLLWQGMGQFIISPPVAIALGRHWNLPSDSKRASLACVLMITGGLFAVGGQVCLTKSLSAERVGPVAILRSTNVIASFAFQSLVTPMDPISSWSILGATCIVLSIAMILVGKGRHRGVKAVVGGGTSTTKPSEATYSVACESSPTPKADKQNKRYLCL